nr:isochorismate synthase [Bacillus sp. FJAT-49736]
MLFGSFAFDPTNRKEPEWEGFSNAVFYLPEAMLTITEKESFLTVNVMIQSGSNLSCFDRIEQWKSKIISISDHTVEIVPEIKNQEEIHPIEWKDSVANTISLLKKGYLNKVVLARKMKLQFNDIVLPTATLHHLLEQQKDSYVFSFGTETNFFTGASPERLVKKLGGNILSTCLAGSIKRSSDKEIDEKLGKMLMEDKKNRQEHQLVVSMIADVFHKYCIAVDIPNAPILMKTRDIQHLYTPVRGKAKEEASLLQMVESLHPTPALGGTPRDEALKVIRDVENMDRGLYAGPIGWMDYRGNGEFIVAIRSGLIKGNEAFIYAGCGIVADSNPEDEYLETNIKFRPMLRALGGKNNE